MPPKSNRDDKRAFKAFQTGPVKGEGNVGSPAADYRAKPPTPADAGGKELKAAVERLSGLVDQVIARIDAIENGGIEGGGGQNSGIGTKSDPERNSVAADPGTDPVPVRIPIASPPPGFGPMASGEIAGPDFDEPESGPKSKSGHWWVLLLPVLAAIVLWYAYTSGRASVEARDRELRDEIERLALPPGS